MEKYISEFNHDMSDYMSRRIIPKAVHICAQMFLSIEVDSPLLKSIPPAMFRSIIERLRVDNQRNTLHTCTLIAAYFDHNVDDIEVFGFCCDVLGPLFWLFYHVEDKSDDAVIEVALTWYRLMAKKRWNENNSHYTNPTEWICNIFWTVETNLANIICDYLRSKTPSLEMIEKIVRDAPSHVVASAVRTSLNEARRLGDGEDDWNL